MPTPQLDTVPSSVRTPGRLRPPDLAWDRVRSEPVVRVTQDACSRSFRLGDDTLDRAMQGVSRCALRRLVARGCGMRRGI